MVPPPLHRRESDFPPPPSYQTLNMGPISVPGGPRTEDEEMDSDGEGEEDAEEEEETVEDDVFEEAKDQSCCPDGEPMAASTVPPPATGGQPSLASPPMFATPVSTVPPPFLLVGLAAIFEAPVCVGSPSFLLLIFRGAGRWHSGTDSPPQQPKSQCPSPTPQLPARRAWHRPFCRTALPGCPACPGTRCPRPCATSSWSASSPSWPGRRNLCPFPWFCLECLEQENPVPEALGGTGLSWWLARQMTSPGGGGGQLPPAKRWWCACALCRCLAAFRWLPSHLSYGFGMPKMASMGTSAPMQVSSLGLLSGHQGGGVRKLHHLHFFA